MPDILDDCSPQALAAACAANELNLIRLFRHLPGAQFGETEELTWISTSIQFPLFNGVVRTNLRSEQLAERVPALLELFRRCGAPMIWWVQLSTKPDQLAGFLQVQGLQELPPSAVMGLDLSRMTTHDTRPDLRIERVGDQGACPTARCSSWQAGARWFRWRKDVAGSENARSATHSQLRLNGIAERPFWDSTTE
jgi:hypothetical protein